MNMGCGTFLFVFIWMFGICMTMGSFIVEPRSDAPLFFILGIISLIVAGIATYYRKQYKETAAQEKLKRAQKVFYDKEKEQQYIAEKEGLQKTLASEQKRARDYQKAAVAAEKLGRMMLQSQEKERDWATRGGIANGIAGPAAGIITAANTIQENAIIRANNAARLNQAANLLQFSDEAKNSDHSKAMTLSEIANRYAVNLSWHPDTLFRKLRFDEAAVSIDNETGAVTISVHWSQNDRSICIDGSLRAKLYNKTTKELAGCAYLVFPIDGTSLRYGTLEGICTYPKPSSDYTVKIEPINLWELSSVGKKINRFSVSSPTDNISPVERLKIVKKYEEDYYAELNQSK